MWEFHKYNALDLPTQCSPSSKTEWVADTATVYLIQDIILLQTEFPGENSKSVGTVSQTELFYFR